MKNKSLKPLALTFFVSGIWDTIAGFLYIFVIGTGRIIDNPPIDPFFAVFLGSFFLCFAYLQFFSAFNIKRYAFNVGCLIIGRAFYVIQLCAYMGFVTDFPTTFWFTGIIDGLFTILYIVFAIRGGLRMGDLFLPVRNYQKPAFRRLTPNSDAFKSRFSTIITKIFFFVNYLIYICPDGPVMKPEEDATIFFEFRYNKNHSS